MVLPMRSRSGERESGVRYRPNQDVDSILSQQLNSLQKKKERNKVILQVACVLAVIVVLTCFVFGAVVIHGDTMAPALQDGDFGFAWKLSSHYGQGDIVLFRLDSVPGIQAGRVVAVPGDRVDIDNRTGELLINKQALDEPYIYSATNRADLAYPVILAQNEYFVLGDNRAEAMDSRYTAVGPVSSKGIVGKLGCAFRHFYTKIV